MVHYNLGMVPEWQWNINKEKETGMRQVILERYMFEKTHVNMVWEDLLDTLGVDQVRINPVEDPDDMEYPEKVELTVTQVRVVE
tara:strand:- start:589 stop:840 length:252 start_codon:yes stop_codon:yes gene_type:complete